MMPSDTSNPLIQTGEIEAYILNSSLEEMEALLTWLKAVVKERRQAVGQQQKALNPSREVLETCRVGTVSYQLELIKCGKKKCKCTKGKLHGPYWYAYWTEGSKLKSKYIGKKKPELSVEDMQEDG